MNTDSRLPTPDSHTYSFEFFPSRTDAGKEKARAAWTELAKLNPNFFSCTFGAGGSTQDGTFDTVTAIQNETGIDAAAHISCISQDRDSIETLLKRYQDAGIKRLVALRGDRPSGTVDEGDFHYANELVEFIREKTGDYFHLEVAAYPEYHPESKSPQADIENFVRKANAGADSVITQYFYNADAYFEFVDDITSQGINLPIVPGIMPITNSEQLIRFSDACGAEIPRWIRLKLEAFQDDKESLLAFGHDVVTDLCWRLLEADVPGLHFYSLNNATPTQKLWQALGLSSSK